MARTSPSLEESASNRYKGHEFPWKQPANDPPILIQAPEEANMTLVKDKCDMFGCREPSYQVLTLGPGTVLRLCLKHFAEEGGKAGQEPGKAHGYRTSPGGFDSKASFARWP